MENEAYQEYFSRTKNKLSLAVWVFLNNNIVTLQMYYAFQLIDFVISLLMILCLYHSVGSIPSLSPSLINAFNFSEPQWMAIVSMSITGVFILILGTICLLIFKNFSFQVYSERRGTFQLLSLFLTMIRLPLFSVVALMILHGFFSFSDVENQYVRYISAICLIINSTSLVVITYLGAYLFKLLLPNGDLIPWSDTTHQPILLYALFKFLLVLTLKLRLDYSLVLIYLLVFFATLTLLYREYHLHFKTHMLSPRPHTL
jgi:hypothetical protein